MEPQDKPDTLLQFPCDFPIKVMGRGDSDLPRRVHDLIRRHAPDTPESAVTTRPSRKGNYLAVTVTIRATSKDQLDAIYRELTAQEWILWAL